MASNLIILAYHRVLEVADPLRPGDIIRSDFARQMRIVSRFFNPVSLAQGVAGLEQGSLPARAVAVTFDDGYADNFTVALPILEEFQIPATVFIATGFLGGKTMWNDAVIEAVRTMRCDTLDLQDIGLAVYDVANNDQKRSTAHALIAALKYQESAEREGSVNTIVERAGGNRFSDLMLTEAQLKALADAGVSIGAHTCSHPILQSIGEDVARAEITNSKAELESLLQRPIRHFAYPNGRPHTDYGAVHVEMVADAGFDFAVSTIQGVADAACDRYQLPRFTPWAEASWRFLLRLLRLSWMQSNAPREQLPPTAAGTGVDSDKTR